MKRSTNLYEDKKETPSRINDYPWVFAENKNTSVKRASSIHSKTGKWLTFASFKKIDGLWKKIKTATEKGLLGPKSKCSTAMGQPRGIKQDEGVIVVYTRNWEAVKDVFRVEEEIRKLGIYQSLYYKTDEDSLAGKYSAFGKGRVSRYISPEKKRFQQIKRRGWLRVETIQGIAHRRMMQLHEAGIKTIKSFIMLKEIDINRILKCGIQQAGLLKMRAFSHYHNVTVNIKSLRNIGENPLCLDIETDLGGNRIWMIGIYSYKLNVFEQLVAYTPRQESTVISKFQKILVKIKPSEIIIFSGSKFDERVLINRLKHYRLALPDNVSFFDVLIELRNAIALPIKSYALENIANYIGFKFRHRNLDGYEIGLIYDEWKMNLRKCPILSKLKDKNEDDLKALKRIIDEFYK